MIMYVCIIHQIRRLPYFSATMPAVVRRRPLDTPRVCMADICGRRFSMSPSDVPRDATRRTSIVEVLVRIPFGEYSARPSCADPPSVRRTPGLASSCSSNVLPSYAVRITTRRTSGGLVMARTSCADAASVRRIPRVFWPAY